MFKKIGILALMLSAAGATVMPTVALAQDGYYVPRDNYYQADRGWERHEAREWREHEYRERRAEGWRQREERQEWREHEWRRNQGYDREYYRNPYPDSDYRR